ncbi:thioesterase domain-containing protein [Streptomyces sp. CA-278952]|uniref:thioesterase II family protein n=1 Tax=Streptomyces sp. CA-278952 TaxID=2980556 RepID=UPI0023680B92|nr:thioesterase domain-containing protein [Streptomyces sp. CA-278952]WDG26875.1 thioesterase domain-containing protein [Streptomyces sp. CA-278952]
MRPFPPAPQAPLRLLCLPHARGSANCFHPVSQRLTPRVETLALQYPGRQDRGYEPYVETVQELADHIVEVIDPWQDEPRRCSGTVRGPRSPRRGGSAHGRALDPC